jgi:hypothetical protein
MNRPPPGQESGGTIRWSILLRIALIIGAGLWAFSPALQGDWLWDDDVLITQNALIHDPAGLWKIWFQPHLLILYFPLTASAQWVEWHLWGDNTFGYHLTNVLLHLGSCLLIWRLFHRLGLKWAWLGGLVFAIHPVNVESVAWISELKNTLSLPPFLLTMCAYLDYDEHRKRTDYFLALGLFLVAMFCKTTMMMFPAVILLYVWWKRGRIGWADLKAGAPFFVASLALGLVTSRFLHPSVDAVNIPTGGILSRITCAGLAISFYFSKCLLPVALMPIYPRWDVTHPSAIQFLPYPILIGILIWCWTQRMTWGRHALLGLGFFLIMLAPFVCVIPMSYTWVMDHLVYIPLIGLLGLAVAGLGQVEKLIPRVFRPLGLGAVTAAIACLSWQSHSYAARFANPETLWSYAVQKNPEAWPAYDNLGAALVTKGDFAAGIARYNQALQIHPCPSVYNNLGLALIQTDRLPEAISAFESARQLAPRYTLTLNHLGFALMETGRVSEAKQQFEAAVQIDPKDEYAKRFLAQIELTEKATLPEQ